MRDFRGRPFRLVTNMATGKPVSAARFVCECCEAKLEFRVTSSKPINPEAITQQAADKGWDVKLRGERAVCPRCVANRKKSAAGESPLQPTAQVIQMQPKTAQPEVVTPRPLTSDERFKVRGLLDKQFDDAKGRYLDGYSDQRIATEVNVPRVHVETMREAAYGPIKVDPEIAKILARITEVEGAFATSSDRIEGLHKACQEELNRQLQELAELRRRVERLDRSAAA